MKTGRLEAFSDGVLAIIITIMVLEIKPPHDTNLESILTILPIFLSYLVSFVYVGIYWNNHHHLFQITEKVNAKVLWANLHLLFWLSLIPFASAWIGENYTKAFPVVFYGVILFMSGVAFNILTQSIAKLHGKESQVHKLTTLGLKEKGSLAIYLFGIAMAFIFPTIGIICYVIVAAIWFIPSKEFEKHSTKN